MTFSDSVKTCFRKYFTFSGRASRSEYWWFWFFWLIVMLILLILNSVLLGPAVVTHQEFVISDDGSQSSEQWQSLEYSSGIFGNVFSLVAFLPGLSVACRRLHDTGRSGWWILLPFVTAIVLAVGLVLFSVGWLSTIEAISTTGNIYIKDPKGGILALITIFATWVTLLVWLCKKSEPGPNAYGPNPHEVSP